MTPPLRLFPPPKTWKPVGGTVDTSHLGNEEDLKDLAVENAFRPSEGYRIDLSEDRISLEIGSQSALRYAWDHLQQLQGSDPKQTACGELEDAPAFPRRGFMLDISRCKVPNREGFLQWLRILRAFRYNELQLYTEHTFAYSEHEAVWKDASPMTAEDLDWLQKEAQNLGIELVPNQNCFGHFERWIKHDAYRHFAESPDGFVTPWGTTRTVGSVLKPDEDSFALVTGLLDELLPLFQSNRVNIGCDETFELGQGATKARCEANGIGAVYAEFVNRIMTYVQDVHGKQPEFWGDILRKYPDELHRIPKNAIALCWGYEADHPFTEQCNTFAQSGLDFVVCPGSSSWQSFAGRTDTMIANVRSAAEAGLDTGAKGILLTDWGDCGHLQQEPVTYPALAWTGLHAWQGTEAREGEAWDWCDQVAFNGQSGDTAKWLAAGRVSELSGVTPGNCNLLFRWFQNPEDPKGEKVSSERLQKIHEALDQLPPPETFQEEWKQTLRNLRLSLQRVTDARENTSLSISLAKEATERHATLWRKRNREGGLAESLQNYSNAPTP